MRPIALLLWVVLLQAGLLAAEPKAKAKDVKPDQAQQLLQSKTNLVVLDVRTPEEYTAGHLKGATNVNFYAKDFEQRLQQLDKNKEYLVYCGVGGRSGKASKKMEELNFRGIYNLVGGMKAWEKQKKPVEK